jgi:transcriptional regulator with XRE-family HTH domain
LILCRKKPKMSCSVTRPKRRPILKALRMARADAGLTISELAERAGVSRDTISNAEKGRHGLQATTLHKLAAALGRAPSELLAEEERLAPKADRRSSLEPSLFNGLEGERRAPSLASWAAFVNRLADRWEREIKSRDEEWRVADPAVSKHVKLLPNLNWANEIRATAGDIVAVASDELEAGLGVYTTEDALDLFRALKRLDNVVDSAEPWFASVAKSEPEGATVHDISEAAERRAERKAAVERIGRQFGA